MNKMDAFGKLWWSTLKSDLVMGEWDEWNRGIFLLFKENYYCVDSLQQGQHLVVYVYGEFYQ